MTTSVAKNFTEDMVQAGNVRIQLRRGGNGDPLLVLHSELGVPGWIDAFEELAKDRTVYVPSLPGFGKSERPDWLMTVRDLAVWVAWCIRDLDLPRPLDVVGFSMGGWLAAEIATIDSTIFRKMVLVGAAGLQPEDGETWDYFMNSGEMAFEQAFHDRDRVPEYAEYYGHEWTDEEAEQVEIDREMSARLLWKPYLRSRTLAPLLGAIQTPTLIVWGREDGIIPVGVCQQYQQAIQGARAVVLNDCGHMPEMEQREEFLSAVVAFLNEA